MPHTLAVHSDVSDIRWYYKLDQLLNNSNDSSINEILIASDIPNPR